ncbi:hypothetical protein [Paenibacillus sp. MMO-58]|uniref:hypothetical protein n=1 Tax=Paenibacillus sp. MMO-58 TaxID=3081290 RepID=UPI0030167F09
MNKEEAQRIADIVNTAGGRTKDIIKVIVCEDCGTVLFGQPQDKGMRKAFSAKTLCPACRHEEEKAKKRQWAAYNKQRSLLEYENSQVRYIGNKHNREKEFYAPVLRVSLVNQNTIHVVTDLGEYHLCDIHNIYDEPHVKDISGTPYAELQQSVFR